MKMSRSGAPEERSRGTLLLGGRYTDTLIAQVVNAKEVAVVNRAGETSDYLSLKIVATASEAVQAQAPRFQNQQTQAQSAAAGREPETSHGSERRLPTKRYKLDAETQGKSHNPSITFW